MAGIFIALFVVWGTEWSKPFPTIFIYIVYEKRERVEQDVEDYGVPVGSPCIVCALTEGIASYMWHLGQYLLMTEKVSARVIG